MPTDRRIPFSTYVVPTRIDTMEEDSISKISFQDTPGKTLGGKGVASISATQWNDSWTSMIHNKVKWEDLDDATDTSGNRWEDMVSPWSGILSLTTSGVALTADGSDCKFLYIKNTGVIKNALVSLNGDSHYYIVIPPGGSICLRGTATLECSDVYVKASHSDGTTIEWVIAQ